MRPVNTANHLRNTAPRIATPAIYINHDIIEKCGSVLYRQIHSGKTCSGENGQRASDGIAACDDISGTSDNVTPMRPLEEYILATSPYCRGLAMEPFFGYMTSTSPPGAIRECGL